MSLDRYVEHTIDVDIVGTKARVWIDGQLYIEATHTWFNDFNGRPAYWVDQGATAEFDDITVLTHGSY